LTLILTREKLSRHWQAFLFNDILITLLRFTFWITFKPRTWRSYDEHNRPWK